MILVGLIGSACGLEVTGSFVEQNREDVLDDADHASSIDSGGAGDAEPLTICDLDDPKLLLCVRFDDKIADESRYAQAINVSGMPAFVQGVSGRAIAMDGSVALVVPHTAVWQYSEVTVELWIRPSQLPPTGKRSGLVDKNGSFGFFLHPDGNLTCSPGPSAPLRDAGEWTHVACVFGKGESSLYVRGVRVASNSDGPPTPTTETLAIGANSPSGDPFIGAIDSLRVYARAKSGAEIARAAVTPSSAGQDAGGQ
jgi:hypothetical protein